LGPTQHFPPRNSPPGLLFDHFARAARHYRLQHRVELVSGGGGRILQGVGSRVALGADCKDAYKAMCSLYARGMASGDIARRGRNVERGRSEAGSLTSEDFRDLLCEGALLLGVAMAAVVIAPLRGDHAVHNNALVHPHLLQRVGVVRLECRVHIGGEFVKVKQLIV